jgi:hypothetical protein
MCICVFVLFALYHAHNRARCACADQVGRREHVVDQSRRIDIGHVVIVVDSGAVEQRVSVIVDSGGNNNDRCRKTNETISTLGRRDFVLFFVKTRL